MSLLSLSPRIARLLVLAGIALSLIFNRALLLRGGGSFIDFGPLLYWLAQWAAFWSLSLGLAALLAHGPRPAAWVAAGGVAWLACVILGLPEFSDMNGPAERRTGIARYVEAKLERRRFGSRHFEVREDGVVGGVALKAGVLASLDGQGKLSELTRQGPAPYAHEGVLVDHAWFRSGTPRMREARLSEDQEIQGYFCAKGQGLPDVAFDESGKLVKFRLSRPQRIAGTVWPSGTFVDVRPGGFVFWPTEQGVRIGEFDIPKDTRIGVSREGKLAALENRYDQPIRRGALLLGPSVRFDAQGRIEEASLFSDAVVGGRRLRKGTRVVFDRRGARSVPRPASDSGD